MGLRPVSCCSWLKVRDVRDDRASTKTNVILKNMSLEVFYVLKHGIRDCCCWHSCCHGSNDRLVNSSFPTNSFDGITVPSC
jgi:hypothetical protein